MQKGVQRELAAETREGCRKGCRENWLLKQERLLREVAAETRQGCGEKRLLKQDRGAERSGC